MITTNLNQHYKDRDPKETVQIIKDFFESKGYTIEEYRCSISEVNTWSCVIKLWWKNLLICSQNGKGLTIDYARASGYAELYERVCNGLFTLWSPLLLHLLSDLKYKKYNYYYAKDEIQTSYDELFADPRIKNQFLLLFSNNEDLLHQYIDIYFNQHYLQVPFKNIANDDILYLNPILTTIYTGSNGMSAGNTYEEAINQGLSELYERYCLNQFLMNSQNQTFYEIDINNIQNEELKQTIHAIESKGNTIHIIDLSYNYHYPVVLGILLNHKTKNIVMNAGSFPVFDIALERIITELYQNKYSHNDYISNLQTPFKSASILDYASENINGLDQNIIDESLFNRLQNIDTYNKNEYLPTGNYSNKDILNWCINKNAEHNNQVYVRDMSLAKNMFAICIYCQNLLITTRIVEDDSLDLENPISFKQQALNIYKNILNHSKQYLNNSIDLYLLISDFIAVDDAYFYYVDALFNGEIVLSPFSVLLDGDRKRIYYFIGTLYNKTFFQQDDITDETIYGLSFIWADYQNTISKYLTLRHYLNDSQYTKEEIKSFFKELNQTITDEDFELFENPIYLLDKMIFEPFKNIYGNHIEEILKGYIECDTLEL